MSKRQKRSIYWDDVNEGDVVEGGEFTVSTDDIKRFASEFDPRQTHLDEAAAEETFFKGLCASGTHTFAMWARLYWGLTPGWADQAGAELFSMKFLRPVRPGDCLSLRFEVTGKRPSPLKKGFGFLDMAHVLSNKEGKPVMRMRCRIMIEQRPGQ